MLLAREDSFFLHVSPLATFLSVRKRRWLVACGRSADQFLFAWVWDGTANPYRSFSSAEQIPEKEPRRQARPKPGLWAVWAPSGFGP